MNNNNPLSTLAPGGWVQFERITEAQRRAGAYWIADGVDRESNRVKISGRWYPLFSVQPIRIKGGWLKRLGFVEREVPDEIRFFEGWINEKLGSIWACELNNFKTLLVDDGLTLVGITYGEDREVLPVPFATIRYVHQLQIFMQYLDYRETITKDGGEDAKREDERSQFDN